MVVLLVTATDQPRCLCSALCTRARRALSVKGITLITAESKGQPVRERGRAACAGVSGSRRTACGGLSMVTGAGADAELAAQPASHTWLAWRSSPLRPSVPALAKGARLVHAHATENASLLAVNM